MFGGAIFKLTQARNGLTKLALVGGRVSGRPHSPRAKPTRPRDAAAVSKTGLQLLHASAKGKFRTKGR